MTTITVPGILDAASVESYDLMFDQNSIWIERQVDSASPQLQQACTNGIEVGTVTLQTGTTFSLEHAMVTAYQVANQGDVQALEMLTLQSPSPIKIGDS